MKDSVTVITLTRLRVELLKRAIDSVKQQDCTEDIQHMIIIDACNETKNFLETLADEAQNLSWYFIPRQQHQKPGPGLVAKLRNYAVQAAKTRWIAFLDDDNQYESNHISSLLACAKQSGCSAVHSYMQIFERDGTPYIKSRLPWCRDDEEGKQQYADLCAKGVFQPGSNIIKDRADPLNHPEPVRTVDTGEWLFERILLLQYPFCTEYTLPDWQNMTTEDDKLLECLIENQVPIACTGLPTFKYYMGGYSNAFTVWEEHTQQ